MIWILIRWIVAGSLIISWFIISNILVGWLYFFPQNNWVEYSDTTTIAPEEGNTKSTVVNNTSLPDSERPPTAQNLWCPSNTCTFQGECIHRPNNAICVSNDSSNARRCIAGFVEVGWTCISQSVYDTQQQEKETLLLQQQQAALAEKQAQIEAQAAKEKAATEATVAAQREAQLLAAQQASQQASQQTVQQTTTQPSTATQTRRRTRAS